MTRSPNCFNFNFCKSKQLCH